ncbi:2999_t:CDS:1, partial [Funneliformis caledonium]
TELILHPPPILKILLRSLGPLCAGDPLLLWYLRRDTWTQRS